MGQSGGAGAPSIPRQECPPWVAGQVPVAPAPPMLPGPDDRGACRSGDCFSLTRSESFLRSSGMGSLSSGIVSIRFGIILRLALESGSFVILF